MSLHLKRLASPRTWHIPKKTHTWVPKPIPGPHAAEKSVPLGLIVRDYLKLATTMREAQRVISNREILVDGKPAWSTKQVVGFMDVLSVPKMGQHYRAVFDNHGRLTLTSVPEANASWKLCRIENKTTIKGGRQQLNLHDGRNVLVKEDAYKTGDVVKVHVPDQKIMGHFPMTQGAVAVITGGKHIGELAQVQEVEVTRNPKPNLVGMKAGEKAFTTIKPYVFVVGKDKPEIQISTGGNQ